MSSNNRKPKGSEKNIRDHPWHSPTIPEVLKELKTQAEGLSENEAQKRLQQFGPNQLPRRPLPGLGIILLRQFKSPLILILAIAAIVSVVIQEYSDAIFIGAVLIINAAIGGSQEWKAEKSNRALEKFLKVLASVSRDGDVREIEAEGVVPGDLVWLEAGHRVPADVRLLQERGLEIDESTLTGESLAVSKDIHWTGTEDTPVSDRKNMAYAGTTVARGRGKGVVVATGSATTIGQLALDVLGIIGGKPPLILRLEKFTRMVGVAVIFSTILVGGIGFLHGYTLMEMFFFAVALGVAAVPEGLLVAITVALAVATSRMAQRGVIARQLAVVEGLGSCTLIASDKTGTLTCNQITVKRLVLSNGQETEVSGEGFAPIEERIGEEKPRSPEQKGPLQDLLRAAILCNEGDLHRHNGEWIWRGDPTDVALLTLGRKYGMTRERELNFFPQVNEIPFEAERQYAASYHQFHGKTHLFIKGAPERIFSMAASQDAEIHSNPLAQTAKQLASQGYRVLALGHSILPALLEPTQTPPEPSQIKILGLVAMIDPLRPEAKQAVQACHDAGIQVSMVTGDHPETALAIARDLGLADSMDQVVTGGEINKQSEAEFQKTVQKIRVFSRVVPHDKLRIVQAAQSQHQFVAVTGDGVNDAPALRAANIGVAMGKGGTDVARDASDMVISDDNFATIVAGVEEGRIAYGNVRNVINLLITQGAAEVLVVALGVLFGLPLPLLPVQLLWLNLVTNGIQDVALAFEPGMGDELNRPPRSPQEGIFNRLMVERVLLGSIVIGVVGFAAYYWMLKSGWSEAAARNGLLLLMVFFENIHLGNCRSETKSAFRLSPFRSPILLFGALGALAIHLLFMYLPWGQKILHTQPIGFETIIWLFGLSLTVFAAMEIHKLTWFFRKKSSNPS